jgi:transposase
MESDFSEYDKIVEYIYPHFEKELSKLKCNMKCRKYSDDEILKCVMFLQNHRWKDLLKYNVNPSTVYYRVKLWISHGVFKKAINSALLEYSTLRQQGDTSAFKTLCIDTTYVKSVQGRKCTGPNSTDRGRKATKISIIIDSLKAPLAYSIHPGNESDIRVAHHTLDTLPNFIHSNDRMVSHLLADKGYACLKTHPLQEHAKRKGCRLVVKPKRNFTDQFISQRDERALKKRVSVEHAFGIMKNISSARLRLRYDHTVESFETHFIIYNLRMIFMAIKKI